MKKYVPVIVALLLLFRSTALCQSPLGISYSGGYVTLSLSNGAVGQLGRTLVAQTTTNFSPPITWTDLTNSWSNGEAGLPATNAQQFFRVASAIPIFEFQVFYNMNFEIGVGQTFIFTAPVFSNGGIWSGSTIVTFYDTVSAVGIATNGAEDPFCPGYLGSGESTYELSGQPTTNNLPLAIMFSGTNMGPTVAESLINIPPTNYALGTAAAFSPAGSAYFANEADLFLTNTPTGTNWNWAGSTVWPQGTNLFLYYQDSANPTNETWVTNDFYALKVGGWTNCIQSSTGIDSITNVKYAGYSFLTNVLFYDWREGWNKGSGPPKAVQAVQLDLAKFNTWLMNTNVNGGSNYNYLCQLASHKNHPIDSIYIYNAVPLTSPILPAIRIVHGKGMPPACGSYGFTLATAQPLYVWGDYNATNSLGSSLDSRSVIYTEPAGLFADSITVLSDNWNDANSVNADKATDTSGGPIASTTEVNAACIAGIVESNPSNTLSEASSQGYSGGVENFLRLLENWSTGSTLWYNGSIVVLFPSQYATNCWQQNGYYDTGAIRFWSYDTNFINFSNLPPLTPTVANYVTP